MTSKIPPRSFRPGTDRGAKIDAWGKARGLNGTQAIIALIDLGLGVNTARGLPTIDPEDGHFGSGRVNRKMTGKLVHEEARDRMRARWSLEAAGVPFGPKPYVPPAAKGAKK